jgi:hypothetical protein
MTTTLAFTHTSTKSVPSTRFRRHPLQRTYDDALVPSPLSNPFGAADHRGWISNLNLALSEEFGTTPVVVVTDYPAMLPTSETLAGLGLTALLCLVAAWVWSTQVVPVSRTKLALSKRNGPVRDYLDELRAAADSDTATPIASLSSSSSLVGDHANDAPNNATVVSTNDNTRALERWLFADWLNNDQSTTSPQRRTSGGRQKEAALPILKNAKWNSGDNPVLAATALISMGVILTSITERVVATIGTSGL